ncbi:MAG: hypothetical protein QOH50_5351, partial [Kribbellaceae bacterium]|nr:hypothetical protein [Kribbellaceae bacterium]
LRVISRQLDRISIQNFVYSESTHLSAGACRKKTGFNRGKLLILKLVKFDDMASRTHFMEYLELPVLVPKSTTRLEDKKY